MDKSKYEVGGKYEVGPEEKIIHVSHYEDITIVVYTDNKQMLQVTKFLGDKVSHCTGLSNEVWIRNISKELTFEQLQYLLRYPGYLLFQGKNTVLSFVVQGVSSHPALKLSNDWYNTKELLDWNFSTNFGPWYQVSQDGYSKWMATW